MNYQKLIIYDFEQLFDILIELQVELKLEVINVLKNHLTDTLVNSKNDHLIITKKIINKYWKI